MKVAVWVMSVVSLVSASSLWSTPAIAAEPKKDVDIVDRVKSAGLMDKPFSMVVVIKIKATESGKFEAEAAKCVAATNKEPGCVHYECVADAESKGTYVFIEKWKSGAALEAHIKAAHTSSLLKLVGEIADGPPSIHFLKGLAGK